jgi:hypothetical protein
MNRYLTLSDTEWALVSDVLEREQRTLQSRVRHSRLPSFREVLSDRLALVDGMLKRLPSASREPTSTQAAV